MIHPTRVDEVAGAGGTDAQAGGAGQATSLVAFLGCELNQHRGLSGIGRRGSVALSFFLRPFFSF